MWVIPFCGTQFRRIALVVLFYAITSFQAKKKHHKKHHNGGHYDSWVMFQTFWIQKNRGLGWAQKVLKKPLTHTNHDLWCFYNTFYHFGVNYTIKCWALCKNKISLSTYHLGNNISRKKLTICGKLIGGITVFNMAIIVKENSTFSWNGQLPYWQRYCMCISSTDI